MRMPPLTRPSGLMFQSHVADAVDLDAPDKHDIPAGEESASGVKSRARDVVDAGKDWFARGMSKLGQKEKKLCAACERIPFDECLPPPSKDNNETPTQVPSKQQAIIFYRSLEKILENSGHCKLCSLLKQSVCQEDHDLLKAEHIRKHLPKGFNENTSMSVWIAKFKDNVDLWPFGYTSDRSSASDYAMDEVEKLFRDAEARDTAMNSVSDMYQSIADDSALAVEAAQLALNMVPLSRIEDQNAREMVAGLQFVFRQVAKFQDMIRHKLPCIFMFRMYRGKEKKAGALSVRVYAHGGAALAPLQEITHFSLRFENIVEPRLFENQLWYGNRLGKRIDIAFFKHCIKECQRHSGEAGCASSLSNPVKPDETEFCLINVQTMSVKVLKFREVMKEDSQYPYTALSYIWGELSLLDGWIPVSEASSEKTTRWKKRTPDGSLVFRNDRPDRTKLTRGHESDILYRDGGLKEMISSIPKTILDAIEVTRDVGLDYLWVDELCIIQDRADPDNKLNIGRMHMIYNHAQFTIVAADGKNAGSGLRGVGCDRGELKQISEEIIPGASMSLPVNIKWDIRLWESRLWTFQEKALSKRLLVFTGGCAIWFCRGGIWREDVNALDGDISAVRFSWPRMAATSALSGDKMGEAGLNFRADGSVRLLRRAAMYDYIAAVEDLSARDISDASEILDAFKGVCKVLESPKRLGTQFWQGLPVQHMDVALLWQTTKPACRPENSSRDDRIPPSWSPFGWETNLKAEGNAAARTLIEYPKPYEVWSDGKGICLRRDPDGTDEEARMRTRGSEKVATEERIRPIRYTLWRPDMSGPSLQPVGLFGRKKIMDGFDPPDWESSNSKTEQPRIPPAKTLDDRTLVIFAQTAILILHQQTWRTTRTSYVKNHDVSRITFEDKDTTSATPGETITTRQEYWLRAQKTDGGISSETRPTNVKGDIEDVKIGVGRIDESGFGAINMSVKAVVLSEAQYLGNEDVPDVFGYPLYTVMLVRQIQKHAGVYERVGLGHVYKSKWRKLSPRKKTVCLI
ncbi:uncharacterized protein J4E88_010160 [Alternaria novae-zelandiae]|uniref:uncharacterized protein n=1 Tax=Alternaria novae-zelandiae TaxID=430562 RepID=UPI0020C3430E|nr:uncharacterized protein J4E88_010160 [Alternaria novae-zelandiae]KAI4667640.1 hypothetical protein J4E88_010160 [Alternaria novae-zelandiae]